MFAGVEGGITGKGGCLGGGVYCCSCRFFPSLSLRFSLLLLFSVASLTARWMGMCYACRIGMSSCLTSMLGFCCGCSGGLSGFRSIWLVVHIEFVEDAYFVSLGMRRILFLLNNTLFNLSLWRMLVLLVWG